MLIQLYLITYTVFEGASVWLYYGLVIHSFCSVVLADDIQDQLKTIRR